MRRLIQAAMCDQTSAIAVETAGDKEFIKVHVLPGGCGFSLTERKPFCVKAATRKEK
jgi:hypothetical protein